MSQRTWRVVCLGYLTFFLAIAIAADLGKLPIAQLQRIPHYDTICHFFLYGIATFLIHRAWRRKLQIGWGFSIPWGLLLFTSFALVEEVLQGFLPHRSASFIDAAADLCGIAIFYWLGERFDRDR